MTDLSLLLRFLLVGGSTALLFLGLTFVLVEGPALNATLASTIACVTAICYNYVLHYHWTFVSDAPHGSVLVRYLVMCAGGILLNGLVMYFGLVAMSIHYMVMQVIAAVALASWSLCVSSLWVFKRN